MDFAAIIPPGLETELFRYLFIVIYVASSINLDFFLSLFEKTRTCRIYRIKSCHCKQERVNLRNKLNDSICSGTLYSCRVLVIQFIL
jgi:hypothetical protein